MKYKAIFCDFDGTLYSNNFTVSEKNIQAIHDYVNHGGNFIISTGRLFKSIYPHLIKMGLDKGCVVVSQGSSAYDIETKKPIFEHDIDLENSVKVAKFMEEKKDILKNNIANIAYIGDECYTKEKNVYVDKLCEIVGIEYHTTEVDLSEYFTKTHNLPNKFLSVVEPTLMEGFISDGKELFKDTINFCRSRDFLVEMQVSGIDKGYAVKKVCEKLGLSIEDVICIGDSENDLAMIKVAGLGVAVSNSYQNVKDEAQYIAPSCDEDAIYDVIHKFCI